MSREIQPVQIEHARDHAFKKWGAKSCWTCRRAKTHPDHHGYVPSLNVLGDGNRFAYRAIKTAWEDRFAALLEQAGLPRPLGRVVVEGEITFPDKRVRDQGNHRGIAGDLSRGKPNPRAAGTNPRAIGRQHVQAVSADAAAVLDSPSDTERQAWERLHTLLARSVEGGAGAVHVMDAYLAGVDGGVFVIDAPTTAWAWLVARADRALPACCDRLGVRARLASDAEHEGLQRVAA